MMRCEAMTAVLQALYRERKEYAERISKHPGIGHPNLTVGLISGGINTNVVPDKVTIRLDRRITPEEDPAQVEAHLRLVIARSVRDFSGISSRDRARPPRLAASPACRARRC